MLQLNFVKALFADVQAVGFGAILRNYNGEVVLVTSIKEGPIQNPELEKH